MGPIEIIILLSAALVTSAISGMLGMAGGVTMISLMTVLLPVAHVVPLHGAIQLASTGTRTLAMRRYIRWRYVFAFAPPMVIGVWLATQVWSGEKLGWFKPAVGLLVLLFLFWRHRKPQLSRLPLWSYFPFGVLTGFLSIFVGAIGPLAAPFFLRDEFSKEEIIGTQAACLAWGHLLKVPAFLSLGFDFGAYAWLLAGLLVCVVCGALIGKHILHRMSTKAFMILFESLLGLIAFYLIGSWVYHIFV